jgi:chromosome segregation ATPase
MALRDDTRDWLGAASATALAELKDEVGRLASELKAVRADAEAQRQRDADALRDDLAALAERLDRNFEEMEERVSGDDATVEALRLKLVGLADQLKWESEDLRKALAAIAERIERKG